MSKKRQAKTKEKPEETLEDPAIEENESEDEKPVFDEDGGEKVREHRKKATIGDHVSHYDQLFALLDSEIDRKCREREKGVRVLRTARKMLTQMRKEVPQITRSREARKQSSLRKPTISGLMKTYTITKELADFLKVPGDTKLSRIDVTRAICTYAHLSDTESREDTLRWKYLNPGGKRNLQYAQDKKSILPDKALSRLLRYDAFRKKVDAGQIKTRTKNKETGKYESSVLKTEALPYWAIQGLLNIHFVKEESLDEEEPEEATS